MGHDGRIYIGGMGQFGYFTPNHLGGLEYTCLSDSLSPNVNVGVIWNIHAFAALFRIAFVNTPDNGCGE